MLITFEGVDGSGKSTQVKLLSKFLKQKSIEHVLTREPGGLAMGDKIREILKSEQMDPKTEVLLLYANRLEHFSKVIKRNSLVISDRFDDSTVAYQHFGRGIPLEEIRKIREFAIGSFQPDLTFLLDIDIELRNKRVNSRTLDSIESSESSFHERVIEGYRRIAKENSYRFVVIDGSKDIEEISSIIIKKVKEFLL